MTDFVYCCHCLLAFNDKEELKLHKISFHKSLFNLKCDKCERRFYSKVRLRQHTEAIHDNPKKKLKIKCKKCHTEFSKMDYLRKHFERMHNK